MDIHREITPKGRIVSSLRRLWLFSRERATAVRHQSNTCEKCHIKGTKKKGEEVKIEVHHKAGICNWDEIVDTIREQILVSPEKLEVLCKECHRKETYGE